MLGLIPKVRPVCRQKPLFCFILFFCNITKKHYLYTAFSLKINFLWISSGIDYLNTLNKLFFNYLKNLIQFSESNNPYTYYTAIYVRITQIIY